MKRWQKSRDYLKKSAGVLLLLGFVSIGAIGGCSNNDGSQGSTRALTENDFSEDPSLSAKADRGIAVTFLEHPDSEKPERDTDGVGIDIIPYKYKRALGNTFCWEYEDEGAEHFMTLVDSNAVEVLMVEANGDCVTEVIEEGDYEMRIHHDGRTEDSIGVFIQVTKDTDEAGARSIDTYQGVLKTAKGIFSETLSKIGITCEANAQTVEENVKTLLSTGACVSCDLHGANLSDADLTNVNLFKANLTNANLTNANLSGEGTSLIEAIFNGADLSGAFLSGVNSFRANLTEANLNGADLSGANFVEANLSGAFLNGANLFGAFLNAANMTDANLPEAILIQADLNDAVLQDADLTNADLTLAMLGNANLSGANLSGADLTNADLTEANLSGATWTDGVCICNANCNNCM